MAIIYNRKINNKLILTIIFSCVFSFYLAEGYISYFNFSDNHEVNKIDFDRRSKFQIYSDLKKDNTNVVMAIGGSAYLSEVKDIQPLSGIANKKTVFCNESGYYSIYQSDRYGFNNPDSEWDQKNTEYLLLGDSFAHGACVNRPDDIGSVLRTLSKKSVLNLGYGGNGPLLEYAALKEYLRPNTKYIFWFYYDNDLLDLQAELKDKILINYFNDSKYKQNLLLQQDKVDAMAYERHNTGNTNFSNKIPNFTFNRKFLNFFTLHNVRRVIFETIKHTQQKNKIDTLDQFKIIIKKANDLATNNKSKFYFIYLPSYYQLTHQNSKSYLEVKKIVNELGIQFIDINEEIFQKEPDPLILFPFKKNNHYNVEGYKKIAELLYKLYK